MMIMISFRIVDISSALPTVTYTDTGRPLSLETVLDAKPSTAGRDATRATLVEVAGELLREQGPAAVTTRAVAQAASVQPPTIYRLFGDKDGLLDAVAEHVLAVYVAGKSPGDEDGGDPVADLRAAWDLHVGFGLANPAVFRLLTDAARGAASPAAAAGLEVLRARVRRVAEAGRPAGRRAPRRRPRPRGGHRRGAHPAPDVFRGARPGPRRRDVRRDRAVDPCRRSRAGRGRDRRRRPRFRTIVPKLAALTDAERTLLSEWLDRSPYG